MALPITRTSFRIYKTNDARTLIEHPVKVFANGSEPTQMLVISDSGISVGLKSQVFPTSQNAILSSQEVMGVIGILELTYGKYLIAVTARKLAATLQSHKIWKVTGGISIPIGAANPLKEGALAEDDLEKFAVDKDILDSVKDIINSGRLFYSTSYDITHSLQHNYFSKVVKPKSTIVDDRYFFNEHLQSALTQVNQETNDTSPWICKLIAGFVGTVDMDHKDEKGISRTYQVVLISRLNHRRLGTRYTRRGLDTEGNAANNVEMEQIVFNHDFTKDQSISSYVQIRGSVPSIWGQDLDLSYRPRLILADTNKESVWAPIRNHYQDLKHQYIGERQFQHGMDNGQVVCVNLLDDTGFEGPLSEIYENTVKRFSDPKIKYESFPMNKWCKKMNFTNMEILVDRVRLPLVNSGWFVAEGDVPSLHSVGTLRCSKIQTGVARVSCLDSLDRTNLTCSIFARYVIPYQVQSISPGLPAVQVLPAATGVAPSEVRDPVSVTRKALHDSYNALTCLWADSGDSISLIYAGTGALKADVTRTGKRQFIKGSYADGMNALTRYYLNNFTHGHLQDTYDVITGKSTVSKMLLLVENEGKQRADRLSHPLLSRTKFPGNIVPPSIMNIVEPVFFNVREGLRSEKQLQISGTEGSSIRVVALLKDLAPEKIDSILELLWAMFLFFWILIFSKLLKIEGRLVVNKPKLTQEDSKLKELVH